MEQVHEAESASTSRTHSSPDLATLVSNAQTAYARRMSSVKQVWTDWQTVGKAVRKGSDYCEKDGDKSGRDIRFGKWLKANKLDGIDRSTRAAIIVLFEPEQLKQEEEWRNHFLTADDRSALNHPRVVARQFFADLRDRDKWIETEPLTEARDAFKAQTEEKQWQAYRKHLDAEAKKVDEAKEARRAEVKAAAEARAKEAKVREAKCTVFQSEHPGQEVPPELKEPPKPEPKPKALIKEQLMASVASATAANEQLVKENEQLKQKEWDLASPEPEVIAKALINKLGKPKAKEVAKAVLQMLKSAA